MLNYIPFFMFLTVANMSYADCSHGAVHIVLRDGEQIDDCTLDEPVCDEGNLSSPMRPWYMHEHFDYYGDAMNPTTEVDAEAAWPSQREEFSDYLFR